MNIEDILAEIAETIESGTSLTMQDLTPEAQAIIRSHFAFEDLPLPDLDNLEEP